MKNFLLALLGVSFLWIAGIEKATAQILTFEADTVSLVTEGTEDPTDFIEIHNYIANISNQAFIYKWRILNPEITPSTWTLFAFCDNNLCHLGGWQQSQEKTSNELLSSDTSDFKLQMKIPRTAEAATVVYAFEVVIGDYVDTGYFKITKVAPSNINGINTPKLSWNLYPNPVQNELYISVPNAKEPYTVAIINILGQNIQTNTINNASGKTSLQVGNMASGQYVISIFNQSGKKLDSKNFTKK
jgi:hypothetical protein